MKTAQQLVEQARQNIKEIDVTDARNQLADCQIIDVREPEEYAQSHLPNALNIPRGVLEFKIGETIADRTVPIIVYCKTGGRASLSAQALQTLGYTAVKSIKGGYEAWVAQNQPTRGYHRNH